MRMNEWVNTIISKSDKHYWRTKHNREMWQKVRGTELCRVVREALWKGEIVAWGPARAERNDDVDFCGGGVGWGAVKRFMQQMQRSARGTNPPCSRSTRKTLSLEHKELESDYNIRRKQRVLSRGAKRFSFPFTTDLWLQCERWVGKNQEWNRDQ